MVSSQNDSIVTDTLLQLTSFSLKSLNEGDNDYDVTTKGLKQIDENFYIDASKNLPYNRENGEEGKKTLLFWVSVHRTCSLRKMAQRFLVYPGCV